MPQQAPAREQTPEEFARSLGGSITRAEEQAKPSLTIDDPAEFAKQLGGNAEPFQTETGPVPPMADHPEAIVTSDRPWDQLWRGLYAAIPDVTGMVGAVIGGAAGTPAGPEGTVVGALAGSGIGGGVGRGIQGVIDYAGGRPDALQNPRSVPQEINQQMLYETVGRAFSGLVGRFQGRLAPEFRLASDRPGAAAQAERMRANEEHGLRSSIGELTDSPAIHRIESLSQRGISGYARQRAARERTNRAVSTAVSGILDTLGPAGTSTGAGVAVQEGVQSAAQRGARRLEGTVGTNIAPKTGMGTAGQMAAEGVQVGRTAFARQQAEFGELVKNAPPVDMTPIHDEAWRIFNEDIMPKLLENPALAPKTADWQKVVRMYRKASQTGERFEVSPERVKALGDAALDSKYGPLRVLNQVIATPAQMSFSGAITLRSALRDAGKGTDLLASDAGEALATYLETGSRVGGFTGIRGLLAATHAPYEAAADAYRVNRDLFQSAFVQKVAETNPEAVLASLTTAEGRFNASRIRDLGRVLQDLPKTYGTDAEVQTGKQAWDTVRAEWFRREIMQDNVFGLADRIGKVDPDVLRAWFPDLAGKNVLQQARVTASAFQSHLLANLAEADPSKIVDMISASPARVREFETSLARLPGPVNRNPLIDRVRRSWTQEHLIAGDPDKLSQRLADTDPDLLKAWYSTPEQQEALQGLQRIGNALSTRRPVVGMGLYESVGAVTVVGNILKGNIGGALRTMLGFEGIPSFLSWAMYNPRIQNYLLEAGTSNGTVVSRTSALIRAVDAYQQATRPPTTPAAPPPAQETR